MKSKLSSVCSCVVTGAVRCTRALSSRMQAASFAREVAVRNVTLDLPFEEDMALHISYRGVLLPVHAHKTRHGSLSLMLPSVTAAAYKEGCKMLTPRTSRYPPLPAAIGRARLLDLVLDAMDAARHASTPAFNLHDHFMLAAAVATAVQMVPESLATNVEVGTFAGHTAIFQASVLRRLDALHARVHAVDSSALIVKGNDFGRRQNIIRAGYESSISLYDNTSERMAPWRRPLRLFFEDSRHNYLGASQSFATFEPALLTGGILMLHDVVCCQREFPSLIKFMQERVINSGLYRELHFDVPVAWSDLPASNVSFLLSALNDSVDYRPGYSERVMSSYPPEQRPGPRIDCSSLCAMNSNRAYMMGGYHWSVCPNVRVFQKLPSNPRIDPLLSLVRQRQRSNGEHAEEIAASAALCRAHDRAHNHA